MGVIVMQPFKNPYSLTELEKRFGIDLSKYTEKQINKYRFKNKGKLARDVKKIVELGG